MRIPPRTPQCERVLWTRPCGLRPQVRAERGKVSGTPRRLRGWSFRCRLAKASPQKARVGRWSHAHSRMDRQIFHLWGTLGARGRSPPTGACRADVPQRGTLAGQGGAAPTPYRGGGAAAVASAQALAAYPNRHRKLLPRSGEGVRPGATALARTWGFPQGGVQRDRTLVRGFAKGAQLLFAPVFAYFLLAQKVGARARPERVEGEKLKILSKAQRGVKKAPQGAACTSNARARRRSKSKI